jgi:hypothetical protein
MYRVSNFINCDKHTRWFFLISKTNSQNAGSLRVNVVHSYILLSNLPAQVYIDRGQGPTDLIKSMKNIAAIIASVSIVATADPCTAGIMASSLARLALNRDIGRCSSDSGYSLLGIVGGKTPTPEQFAKILVSSSCNDLYSAIQKLDFPDCTVNGKPVGDIKTLPLADGMPMLITSFVPTYAAPSKPANPPAPAPTTAPSDAPAPAPATTASGDAPAPAPATTASGDAPAPAPATTASGDASAPAPTTTASGDASVAPVDDDATVLPVDDSAATPEETMASDMNATATDETPADEANTSPSADAKDNAASSMMVTTASMTVAALAVANLM